MSQYPPKLPNPPHPAPAPYTYPQQQYQQPQSNVLAITALVCGIIGLILAPIGLVAVILGIIALVKTRKPTSGGKGMAIAGIITGALGVVLVPAILLPALSRAREQAIRAQCMSNMRQIGTALIMYQQQDRRHAYPPDLATLATTIDLEPRTFCCPGSNASAAQTTQAIKAGSPNCSYVYIVPKGFTDKPIPGDFVLLYEPTSVHRGEGTNVGFADGSVRWFAKPQAEKLIAEVEAGQNPSSAR